MAPLLNLIDIIPPESREEALKFFHGIFGSSNPLVVELGSGNGHFLTECALKCPARSYIGIELLAGRASKFQKKIDKKGLNNIIAFRGDIRQFVWEFIYEEMVEEFIALFPDPWPKKRHHKHRLFQKPFIDMLKHRLVPGGVITIATDFAGYREWILEAFSASSEFRNLFDAGYSSYPEGYPSTLFSKRFESQGKEIGFMRFTKVKSVHPAWSAKSP